MSTQQDTTSNTKPTPKDVPEQFNKCSRTGNCNFKSLTGYATDNFKSYESFTNWLHRPVDCSALGVFRILYGLVMMIDIAEERGGGQMDVRYGEPNHCHFPLFDGIQAASFPIMGCVYLIMWLGALGIALGYHFRLSCCAFILPYWYIFLLDKPAWNNHSYLFGLVGTLFLFTQANRYCSLDSYLQTPKQRQQQPQTVPYWNYFLIKFQFFILYMYAGLKKFTAEWLSGYAMSSLSEHWVFTPFRIILSAELTDLLIVHWFTAIFDFSIAFLMTCERTRLLATPFMLSFHLMNSRLFTIGMFPWVCLAEVPLFFGFDWPRRLYASLKQAACLRAGTTRKNVESTTTKMNSTNRIELLQERPLVIGKGENKFNVKLTPGTHLRMFAIATYCVWQLLMPYSHFITKGFNNWTNGLYGYSWDMMVHSYDTILTSIKIVDNSNGKVHFLEPYAFTQYDRWTKYADMAVQYAKCIESNIKSEQQRNPHASPLTSTNISIYFDIWCSMNGRFQQRVFDPRVDLLQAEWSPFKHTTWTLPLLNELNHMRPKLRNIATEVLSWNNYSDVIFVADFPGLTLDNHISTDLTNVTLTILEGNVRYKSDDDPEAYFLTAGKSISLRSGEVHQIRTIGMKPSCYLYTYVNRTMLEGEILIHGESTTHAVKSKGKTLAIWQEFNDRLKNYKRFIMHIGNCLLFLVYGVPIPMEIRTR